MHTSRALVWPINPALSPDANPSDVKPRPLICEWEATRAELPEEDVDGGGNALWATGADVEGFELIVCEWPRNEQETRARRCDFLNFCWLAWGLFSAFDSCPFYTFSPLCPRLNVLMSRPEWTLKHFILQQQVLALYRRAIRASRGERLNIHLSRTPDYILRHIKPFFSKGNHTVD